MTNNTIKHLGKMCIRDRVYPTRRELEYTYVQKAGIFYDLKMIVYTVICILYAVYGKECTWILDVYKRQGIQRPFTTVILGLIILRS